MNIFSERSVRTEKVLGESNENKCDLLVGFSPPIWPILTLITNIRLYWASHNINDHFQGLRQSSEKCLFNGSLSRLHFEEE
jgi:hypothetical protein